MALCSENRDKGTRTILCTWAPWILDFEIKTKKGVCISFGKMNTDVAVFISRSCPRDTVEDFRLFSFECHYSQHEAMNLKSCRAQNLIFEFISVFQCPSHLPAESKPSLLRLLRATFRRTSCFSFLDYTLRSPRILDVIPRNIEEYRFDRHWLQLRWIRYEILQVDAVARIFVQIVNQWEIGRFM
jgi:hypothetical protein